MRFCVGYINDFDYTKQPLEQAEGRADTRPSRGIYRWKRLQDALRPYKSVRTSA